MILLLEPGTSEEESRAVLSTLEGLGLRGNLLQVNGRPIVHVVDGPTRLARKLRRMESVEAIVATSGPRIRREGRRFYPYHFIGWCASGLVLLGILVALAGFLPPGLGSELDPRKPPPDLVAPWFLRAPRALLELLPGAFGWIVLAGLVLVVFCVPFLDRSDDAGKRSTPLRGAIVLAVAVGWLLFTLLGIR